MKKDRFAQCKTMPTDYDQMIHLTDMVGMGKLIASAMIKEYGFYACTMLRDGKELKTVVVK